MTTSPRPPVLICGAGPTGLLLALRLARFGVAVRIVDRAAEPGTTSRALVVHARTLELYRQIGIAEAFLAECLPFEAINLWVRGRHRARVSFPLMGKGLSPFPYAVVCPQDRHERFLIDRLREAGIEVERPVELTGFEEVPGGIRARLLHAGGIEETCEADYLAGCDGAHSKVREVLGVGFPGGTYSRFFYVADVAARGPVMNGELHAALDDANLLAVFPLAGGTTARLVGTIDSAAESARENLRFEDVSPDAVRQMRIEVERVNWFSTYRVHHRVATRFRVGRAFLLGDAGHVHSPVGGQGMNTGLGDAANLAWKLADVLQGRARETLLDSYEPERIAFARRLVRTTDRAFVIGTSTGPIARFVRTRVVPVVVPFALRFAAVRRLAFRTLSQIGIHYRTSPLSSGRAGAIHGGDRLPWVLLGEGAAHRDNHEVLDGVGWQVHVYGKPAAGVSDACREHGFALHVFEWRPAMATGGFVRDALYLIRPDGYVALADGTGSQSRFRDLYG